MLLDSTVEKEMDSKSPQWSGQWQVLNQGVGREAPNESFLTRPPLVAGLSSESRLFGEIRRNQIVENFEGMSW